METRKPQKTTIYLDPEIKQYLLYQAIIKNSSMSGLINAQFRNKKIRNKIEEEEAILKQLLKEYGL